MQWNGLGVKFLNVWTFLWSRNSVSVGLHDGGVYLIGKVLGILGFFFFVVWDILDYIRPNECNVTLD